MWRGDKAHQRVPGNAGRTSGIASWLRRLAHPKGDSRPETSRAETPRLHLLGELIDGVLLPDGVVELVVDDRHLSIRYLFDVRDGAVVAIEPGSTVPWTSIRGSRSAWAAALGSGRDVSQLHHTGEPQLAESVLTALETRRLRHDRDSPGYSVLDCS